MCIAIANKKNKPLSDQEIINCWENNSDGAGILYKQNGKLKIFKEMNSVDKYLKKYKKLITQSNCVLHFRISTHGGVNEKNCHPFFVNHKLGFAHNGVISGYGTKVKDQSDTYSFNQFILKKLPEGFQNNEAICEMLSDVIGYSKLVFMDIDENFTIINPQKGKWDEEKENWYSNDSYKRVNNYVWAGNKKVYKDQGKKSNNGLTKTTGRHTVCSIPTDTNKKLLKSTYDRDTFQVMDVTQEGLRAWKWGGAIPDDVVATWDEDYQAYVESVVDQEDLTWWEQNIETIGTQMYIDMYELFEQVPTEVWDRPEPLQEARMYIVRYVDPDAQTSTSMNLGIAINLLLKRYQVQDKITFEQCVEMMV